MLTLNAMKLIYKIHGQERYCVCMQNTNVVRCCVETLYEVASEMFGFGMADTKVFAYDLKEDRILQPSEYDREMKKVIEIQKQMGVL